MFLLFCIVFFEYAKKLTSNPYEYWNTWNSLHICTLSCWRVVSRVPSDLFLLWSPCHSMCTCLIWLLRGTWCAGASWTSWRSGFCICYRQKGVRAWSPYHVHLRSVALIKCSTDICSSNVHTGKIHSHASFSELMYLFSLLPHYLHHYGHHHYYHHHYHCHHHYVQLRPWQLQLRYSQN